MKSLLLFLLLCSFSINASDFIERDSTSGVVGPKYTTLQDSNRYALSIHMNGNVMKPTDYMNFEFVYSTKMQYCWLDFFVAKSTGKASAYSTSNDETINGMLSGGIGVNYRFHFLKDVIKSRRVFETTSAAIAVYQYSDNLNAYSYLGGGIKVDYGIHYRSSSKFHYGIKFSYNLGSVIREAAIANESRRQRTLALSWTSFALEMAYYF